LFFSQWKGKTLG